MPSKNHKDKISEIREKYENAGFRCKQEFMVWRPDEKRFSQIDICCFHPSKSPRCFEVEVAGKQVVSNQKDLKEAAKVFQAKTCQLTPNDEISSCDCFKKN